MLLTSSQVSIAFTSGIVILCTFSLFLSGYVLQQRTLAHLRAAIREPPRPSPQLFLPDRFQTLTTELEDGTVVDYDPNAAAVDGEDAQVAVGGEDAQQVITVPETEAKTTAGEKQEDSARSDPNFQPWAARLKEIELREEAKEQADKDVSGDAGDGAPAELSAEEAVKPLSAAERRRRIKAEIRRLAQGTEPVYYQRRLY